ncbi:MAG: phage tail protein [Gemmatimonadetes bacterium]|nr:phage tail protein [Gemmatimonadota bacterium]
MSGEADTGAAPLPSPRFTVDIAGVAKGLQFTEVSGLDVEIDGVDYRTPHSPAFASMRVPGMRASTTIVLTRGSAPRSREFLQWFQGMMMRTVERSQVTITRLDENGQPVARWILNNALPVKFSGVGLKATGNEVAIEVLEFTHEGLSVSTD